MELLSNTSIVEDLSGKYLTFALAHEIYGVQILKVQEIIGIINITPIPQTPDYIKGLINLRGSIIPVVDLRIKFGLPKRNYDQKTCIIVVGIEVKNKIIPVGVVVDTVLEVVNFSKEELQPPPDYGCQIDTKMITAIGKVQERVMLLVDIELALDEEAKELIRQNVSTQV